VYDGTTVATLTSNSVVLAGVLAGDTNNVSLSTNGYAANFTSAGVGNGVPVVVSGLTLTGSASGNYTLAQPTNLAANITGKGVTISSGLSANGKVYDGTTVATLTSNSVVLAGVLAGDTNNVALSTNGYVASFASAAVSNNVPVNVSGLSLVGSAAGNYALSLPTNLTANITGRGVTISSGLSANGKVYDGTTVATLTSNNVVLAGVLSADTNNVSLSTNGYVANFTSAGVSNNVPVNVSGLSLVGSAAGNYALSLPTNLTANITGKGVTISSGLSANGKVYDGTTVATLTSNNVVLAGVLAGDTNNVSLSTNGYVASFTSAGVSNNVPVTVSGLTLMGSASGNYALSLPTNLAANITPKALTIAPTLPQPVITSIGLTNGVVTIMWSSVTGGIYRVQYSGSLNGGSWTDLSPDVTATGLTATQTNAVGSAPQQFYRVRLLNSGLMGLSANNKVYDGTTVSTLSSNNVVLVGVINGDSVSLVTNGYIANFATANVGTYIPVSVSGLTLSGVSAGNYTLNQPTGLNANITGEGVTITSGLTANNKMYDGTAVATLTSNAVVLAGVLAGDTNNVGLNTNGYAASFASINVGTNIAVNVSGLTLVGGAVGNYTLTQPTNITANITPVTLTVSAVNQSKTYGLPNPPLTVSYSGFVNNEGTNVLAGVPNVSTTATTNSPPGTYTIVVSAGTLSATNYIFTFVYGTLTVVAPQLNGVVLNGNQLIFSWPTIPNQSYQLQYTTNLTTSAWTPLGSPMIGTGNSITVTNLIGASPQSFFRLIISQ
jgi:hypothetical protein